MKLIYADTRLAAVIFERDLSAPFNEIEVVTNALAEESGAITRLLSEREYPDAVTMRARADFIEGLLRELLAGPPA